MKRGPVVYRPVLSDAQRAELDSWTQRRLNAEIALNLIRLVSVIPLEKIAAGVVR